MQWFIDWFTNPFLLVPLMSWVIAQVMKVIINFCVTRKLSIERLFGDGGMPSGHSATVSALATYCGLCCGTASVEFALAMILAIIVCHDATGVRQEAGKHAVLLEEILNSFDDIYREKIPEMKLKKFVGHTFWQVLAGVCIGVGNALLCYFFIF